MSSIPVALNTQPFGFLTPQSLDIDFEFGISDEIYRLGASSIDLVLEIRSPFYYACDL